MNVSDFDVTISYNNKMNQSKGNLMYKQYSNILETINNDFLTYDLKEFCKFLELNDIPSRLEHSFRKNLLQFVYLETNEEFLMQVFVEEKLYSLLLAWLKKNRLIETQTYANLYHKALIHFDMISKKLLNERSFYGNKDNIKLAVEKYCKGQNLLLISDSSPYKQKTFPVKSAILPLATCSHCGKKSCAIISISGNLYFDNVYIIEFICLECHEFSTGSSMPEIWSKWIELDKEIKHPDFLLKDFNLNGFIFDKSDDYVKLPKITRELVLNDRKSSKLETT